MTELDTPTAKSYMIEHLGKQLDSVTVKALIRRTQLHFWSESPAILDALDELTAANIVEISDDAHIKLTTPVEED